MCAGPRGCRWRDGRVNLDGMTPRWFATILIGGLLGACGDDGGATMPIDGRPIVTPDAIDADPGALPQVEATPCRFSVNPSLGLTEGAGYSCGDLIVAENRAAPTRTIRVHFIRFDSAAASANATVYLDGGPGGDGQRILDFAAFLGPSFLGGLLVDGDFIVIGQRGTSRSIPFLDCQGDCPDVDLPSYNTAYNADDVGDLRAALGIAQLNLYGISYGSRLGLEVLRRHGEHVRAAVIEGLVPAQIVWTAAIPASFYNAITALRTSCNAAGACGAAYGDLVAKFLVGVDALNANPVTIQLPGGDVGLDGYTYASLLFRMMYSRSSFIWLPILINDLAERRVDRVAGFLGAWLEQGGASTLSFGLYYSVVCGELYAPPAAGAFEAANADVPEPFVQLFGGSYYNLLDFCQSWPTGNLQAELAQPVTSAVPTLVSSGALDPITPPGFGDIAAATLSRATVVVHANSGHGATLQSPCGTQHLHRFLANPTAPLDTSCAATITTAYVLPATLAAARISHEQIRLDAWLAPPLAPLRR